MGLFSFLFWKHSGEVISEVRHCVPMISSELTRRNFTDGEAVDIFVDRLVEILLMQVEEQDNTNS